MDSGQLVDVLNAENARLRDRIAWLEDAMMAVKPLPREWRLTAQEARVFGVLANREVATKEAVMVGLYSDRPDEDVAIKIVDVYVCKLRKKLTPFGIKIETIWGRGYSLASEHRDAFRRGELQARAA